MVLIVTIAVFSAGAYVYKKCGGNPRWIPPAAGAVGFALFFVLMLLHSLHLA
jgi:hypothetical protein